MKFLVGWIFMLGTIFSGETFAMGPAKETKPTVVLLMGPPGAGKGTHAVPLGNFLGIPHISSGDLFRENIREQTSFGKRAKSFIDQGKLVPDEVVLEMLFSRISQSDCKHGCILDGFPRTLAQAEALDKRLESGKYQIIAINLDVPDSLLIERISGRIVCKNCGAPYHKKYNPPKTENVCDGCSGILYQRDDDKEEILRKRLEVYRQETQPLIEYYGRKEGVLREIEAQNSREKVFQDVVEAVTTITHLVNVS